MRYLNISLCVQQETSKEGQEYIPHLSHTKRFYKFHLQNFFLLLYNLYLPTQFRLGLSLSSERIHTYFTERIKQQWLAPQIRTQRNVWYMLLMPYQPETCPWCKLHDLNHMRKQKAWSSWRPQGKQCLLTTCFHQE